MKNVFLQKLLKTTTDHLQPLYRDTRVARDHAWYIIEHCTKKNKTELLSSPPHKLTFHEQNLLEKVLNNMVEHRMPIAYALGSVPFLSLDITIYPPILIPRPDTEYWCAMVIKEVEPLIKKATADNPFIVLDLCTGSGCIALSIANHFCKNAVRVVGVDISEVALSCAALNAQKLSLNNCTFIRSDIYQSLPKGFKADLIVANPPYIDEYEYQKLEPEVRLWEDKQALVAKEGGYAIIGQIAQKAKQFLRNTHGYGKLWCEIGAHQKKGATSIFKEFGLDNSQIIKDIAGRDRVIKAKGA